MSFEPIETDLFSDKYRPLPASLRAPMKPGPMTETSARKLRAKGLSYRRIASELRVRYDQVSHWLSGIAPAAPSAPQTPGIPRRSAPPNEPPARPSPEPPGTEAALTRRINDLMATLRQIAREGREREDRLHQVVEAERSAAREQAGRRDAELATLRATVKELAGRLGALEAAEAAPRRTLWRRGAAR